ncbi:MAG TPA: DUF6455 family protein [Stellaceae bacterium]|nr:DUF6455 family protein [Stellaceae bacterium]
MVSASQRPARSGLWRCCGGLFATGVEHLRTVVRDARARHRIKSEFAALDRCGELDPMLRDFGFDRSAAPKIVDNHPRAPRRLSAMLQRLGIEPTAEQQQSTEMREIQRTCLVCGAGGKCDHWLAVGKPGEDRSFCPNAEALDRLSGKARQQS